MSSTTPKINIINISYTNEPEKLTSGKSSSFRKDFSNIELSVGHVPSYDEEQESEVHKEWYEPLKS